MKLGWQSNDVLRQSIRTVVSFCFEPKYLIMYEFIGHEHVQRYASTCHVHVDVLLCFYYFSPVLYLHNVAPSQYVLHIMLLCTLVSYTYQVCRGYVQVTSAKWQCMQVYAYTSAKWQCMQVYAYTCYTYQVCRGYVQVTNAKWQLSNFFQPNNSHA